jgi:branched-chain amino acid transport system permease protein
MRELLEILINGVSMGAIYALMAIGFVLIFKSTGVINFAQGELGMMGAFICYTFATLMGVSYFYAFLIALAGGFILGVVVYKIFFSTTLHESLFSTIMITVGLGSILTCVAGLIWGHDVYPLNSPFTDKTFSLKGVVLSQGSMFTIAVSIFILILFVVFFSRSRLGIFMRGSAEDADTAGLMGVNVKKIYMFAWALGTTVAALSGILFAEQGFVRLSMSHVGIKAMSAAILGGMESISGAILGGIIVGVVEGFAANFMSGIEFGDFHIGDIKDVAAFVIMLLVLMIRPYGIFGREKVERV